MSFGMVTEFPDDMLKTMTNGGRPGNEIKQECLKAQIRCYLARFGLIAVVENKTDSRDPAALRKQPSHRTYSRRPCLERCWKPEGAVW